MTTRKLQASEFTGAVDTEVKNLKEHFDGRLVVSDLIDEEDHQYVDIVMEGGGVLGIALVGYLYVMEQMNIRFLRTAGASAGSIIALLLASLGEIKEEKSVKLIEHLANLDLFKFVDGDQGTKQFVRHLLEEKDENDDNLFERLAGYTRTGIKAVGILDELLRGDLGLNPGVEFLNWLKDVLAGAESDVTTNGKLKKHLQKVPTLCHWVRTEDPIELGPQEARLALVTADVSTESKIEFPKMATLYYTNPDEVSPADFVRASVSIPFFFHPFSLDNIAQKISNQDRAAFENNWRESTGFDFEEEGGWPDKHFFIDGGIVSNFPIALFHNTKSVPKSPTFGVKLGKDTRKSQIKSLSPLAGAIFNSARHVLDLDFMLRNPDYQHLITIIDTGRNHWLNFELSPEAKIDLFVRGAKCAAEFLRKFEWEKYKDIRQNLLQAYKLSEDLKSAK
jgi:NTE family protein